MGLAGLQSYLSFLSAGTERLRTRSDVSFRERKGTKTCVTGGGGRLVGLVGHAAAGGPGKGWGQSIGVARAGKGGVSRKAGAGDQRKAEAGPEEGFLGWGRWKCGDTSRKSVGTGKVGDTWARGRSCGTGKGRGDTQSVKAGWCNRERPGTPEKAVGEVGMGGHSEEGQV